jgi:hypothetical protein
MLTDLAAALPGMPELVSGMEDYLAMYRGLTEQTGPVTNLIPDATMTTF